MDIYKMTEDQLEDALSINFVNCTKLTGSLFKYMPASRVLEILKNTPHQIAFVSPEKWYDPYETKFLNTDYTALNGYKQPKVYCFCARMDNLNEEASWKIYKNDNEPLLRLKLNTIDFLSSLSDFAKNNQCDLYFSKVDYRLKKKDIDSLSLPSSNYYHEFFDNFDDEQYVKVMSLKRMAFSYENEYRIFLIPRNQDAINNYLKDDDDEILNIPIPIEVITRFTFNPAKKTDGSFLSQIDKAKYDAEYKLIKQKILSYYPAANVFKSPLYTQVSKVDKIQI